MTEFNLRTIFSHIVDDETFLSTIIDLSAETLDKKEKKKKFNLLTDMVTDYNPLVPYEKQDYKMLPLKVKKYLTPAFARYGVKNMTTKNMNIVNMSFLNSFNVLLRPELVNATIEDQIKNMTLLESYIMHTIDRGYQIDKIKRTKKVKAQNKELIQQLADGKISHALIDNIVNIFEINLVVFDLTKSESYLYWTRSVRYPYFNPFKDLYCMVFVQGNYEPLMPPNNILPEKHKLRIYQKILFDIADFKNTENLELGLHTILFMEGWNINNSQFLEIANRYAIKVREKRIHGK